MTSKLETDLKKPQKETEEKHVVYTVSVNLKTEYCSYPVDKLYEFQCLLALCFI